MQNQKRNSKRLISNYFLAILLPSVSEGLILHGLFRCVLQSWGFHWPAVIDHKHRCMCVASTWDVSSKGERHNQWWAIGLSQNTTAHTDSSAIVCVRTLRSTAGATGAFNKTTKNFQCHLFALILQRWELRWEGFFFSFGRNVMVLNL